MPVNMFNAMHNATAGVGQSAMAGQRNALAMAGGMQQLEQNRGAAEHAEQTRNLLAQVSMSGSPQEKVEALNQLMAVNPEAAHEFQSMEREQQQFQVEQEAREHEQRQKRSSEIVSRMNFVLEAEDPVQALRLAGRMPDGADLLERLAAEGIIDPEDGIDADEARAIAQAFRDEHSHILAGADERAEPSLIREMRAVGIDPNTAEGQQTWLDLKMREGATDQQLEQLRLQMLQNQFTREQREAEQAERTAEQQRQTATYEINTTLKHLEEAAEINDRLADTWLRTGGAGLDMRRTLGGTLAEVSSALGMPRPEAERVVSDFNRLQKLTSELLVQSMGRISGSGMGQMTNDRLQLMMQSMANVGNDPRANDLVIADAIDSLVSSGGIEGLDVQDAERRLEISRQLREGRQAAPASGAPPGAQGAPPGPDASDDEILEFYRAR